MRLTEIDVTTILVVAAIILSVVANIQALRALLRVQTSFKMHLETAKLSKRIAGVMTLIGKRVEYLESWKEKGDK